MPVKETISKIRQRIHTLWSYCSEGVWSDMRPTLTVRLVKTLNLSVKTFFNGDVQTKACAMTYRTVLAIVPALALILAIGKGFGLQHILREELTSTFATQQETLYVVFDFVESYLSQSTGGVFLGIGVVLLLWTLISILGSVEKSFNEIWGISSGRSMWRKITDYLAIFIILPVLMVCASGISVFFSTTLSTILPDSLATPLMSITLDIASLVLIWFFFTGVYILIPTTKVKFRNAFAAGVFAGTCYLILQWLFVSGQIYVSKYNAIYGGFAFIPLLLIWLQLVWVITYAGAVICYASQNIFRYNFSTEISRISPDYRMKIVVSVMSVICKGYLNGKPLSETEIAEEYGLPPRLVASSVNRLMEVKLIIRAISDPKVEVFEYVPAIDPAILTVGEVVDRIRTNGSSDFIPKFSERFPKVISVLSNAEKAMVEKTRSTLIKDL